MIRRPLVALFAVCAIIAGAATVASAHHPTRTTPRTAVTKPLSLDLEFNGSTLPPQLSTGWFGAGVTAPVNKGGETACYAPSHVNVAGGFLDLRLTNDPCTVGGHTYPMTTGAVSSNGHFSFTNGTVRARIFIDGDTHGVWNWPAFWTDGQSWPNDGESDIAEGLGGHVCFHVHDKPHQGGIGGCPAGNFVGWHNFKETVLNGLTTYFYDGKQVGQEQNASSPQYLVAGMQAGSFGGQVVTPSDMLIDWIRVKATPASAPTSCAHPQTLTNYEGTIQWPGDIQTQQDVWQQVGKQTMRVCGPDNWQAVVTQSGPPASGVKTYPDSQKTYTNWASPCATQPRVDSFTKWRATWAITGPRAGAWDTTADVFLNNTCGEPLTEVMVLSQYRGFDFPASQRVRINGVDYLWYHSGTLIQFRQVHQAVSASVNLRALMRWLEGRQLVNRNDTAQFAAGGAEVLTTRGQPERFTLSAFKVDTTVGG